MSRILIIEDERVIRRALARLLERNGYGTSEAESIPAAEEAHDLASFDLIITDLRLPGPPGTEVIERCGSVPVLIMTSYASVKSAVEAMQQGAADYIAKPFDHDEMLHAVKSCLSASQLRRQNAALKSDLQRSYPVAGMVGSSAAMEEVFNRIRKVAPTDSTVLILGESGTGKELVARAVHEYSGRRDGPMIAVNCAAIPESLIESELFGHEKGAFTGAGAARAGMVEAAAGGTLFLDEIGELPLAAQGNLLRLLQEGEIRRVGAARPARVNVRLMAATNRQLESEVKQGRFREDLFYRLQVMEILLPPLRERGDDITQLAEYMLAKACQRLNRAAVSLSPDALQAVRAYPWPGNVRELENVLERAVILSEGGTLTAASLALQKPTEGPDTKGDGTSEPAPVNLSLDEYFRHYLLSNQDHMTETELARGLGISRKSLWERRQRLGVPRQGRA
jgi:DNA-binding NtrC family response regulator